MTKLTTINGGPIVDIDKMIATLPRWLQYLIGAFPSAKATKWTYITYESTFADVDAAVMFKAVKQAVKRQAFHTWPTIAELQQLINEHGDGYDPAFSPVRYGRFVAYGQYRTVSDEELLKWEINRGALEVVNGS